MIKKFKIFEGISWWKDGELSDEEEDFVENEFKVGDIVKKIGVAYYIDDNKWKESVAITGSNQIKKVKDVVDYYGYTGQLIKIGNYWPLFKATNFIKV